jgi:hypothetical protein
VADRNNNNRIQVFDQDGAFIWEMRQFSRPSGVYIDKRDNIYVADSESESVSRNHNGWKRGIRVGNLKDGKSVAFIRTRWRRLRGPAPRKEWRLMRREISVAPKWGQWT